MMNRSVWCVVGILGFLLGVTHCEAAAAVASSDSDTEAYLQVHLPREVAVQDNQLSLAQVGVVRGPEALVAEVSDIGLGRISLPGQKVVVDRPTILSRLASSGISAQRVRFTGAKAVTVRRQQTVIEAEDFVEVGRRFLRQYPLAEQVCEIVAAVRPQALTLSKVPEDVQLTPQLVNGGTRGLVVVRVGVTIDGQAVGTRDIAFRVRYKCRKVLASKQIPEGTALSPENVKIEASVSNQPEPVDWKPPYGAVALRTLAANVEIRSSMISAGKSTVKIRRNETVQIRIERSGLSVTAMGMALQEGCAGEYVKVRNADSRRVIICQVKPDGTVEPML